MVVLKKIFITTFIIVVAFILINTGYIEKLSDDDRVGKLVYVDKKLGYTLQMDEFYWGKKNDFYFMGQGFPSEKLKGGYSGIYKITGLYRKTPVGLDGLFNSAISFYQVEPLQPKQKSKEFLPFFQDKRLFLFKISVDECKEAKGLEYNYYCSD